MAGDAGCIEDPRIVHLDGRYYITYAYRAYHPKDEKELADFRALLDQNLVRPGHLDLWVMNKDGSNKRRITDLPGASFAPSFLPGNTGLIFSTNPASTQ